MMSIVFLISSALLIALTNGTALVCPVHALIWHYEAEGTCIKYVSDEVSQTAAKQDCSVKGSLVMLKDETKDNFVKAKLESSSLSDTVWIGLERGSGSSFAFPDGRDVQEYNHEPWVTEPSFDNTGFSCVSRTNNPLKWIITECSTTLNYICEFPAEAPILECDNGWHMNTDGDACLKAIKKHKRTFEGARKFCQKFEGDLATKITSRKQRGHAMGVTKLWAHFWIGVQSLSSDGTFTDFDGNTLDSTPFKKPVGDRSDNHCVSMKKRRWYAKKCNKRQFFLCQKDPKPQVV